MGRFIVHGTITEEPKRSKFKNGIDVMTVTLEERTQGAFKEQVNMYSIDFIGRNTDCVPQNARLAGSVAIVVGQVASREYKGKIYTNLYGDGFTLVTLEAPQYADDEDRPPVPAQAGETPQTVDEDDLPF